MFDHGDDSFVTILYFGGAYRIIVLIGLQFLLRFDFISDIVITKTNQLMLFRQIILDYYGNHTKHINALHV
jgi:hypothetical protein